MSFGDIRDEPIRFNDKHPGFKGEWEPWRPPEEKAYDIERGKRT